MRIFYLFSLFILGNSLVIAQTSTLSWSSPITVANGANFGNSWPRIVLTDNNVPVVMWGDKSADRIYVSRLTGTSFSTPVDVVPSGIDAFVEDWAGPDIGARGDSVFVTFKSLPSMGGSIYVVRSLNGGITFSDTVAAESIEPDVPRFPAIDVAPGGNPVVTFMRFSSSLTDPEYEIVSSPDGGQSFSSPIPGSNLAPGEVCDCCPTDIRIYGDKQLLPFRNNDNNIRDTWLALSNNSGASFDTVLSVDNSAWWIQSCPSSGPDAALSGDSIVSVWMTGAFGPGQVWMSSIHKNTYQMGSNREIDYINSGGQFVPRIVAKNDTLGVIWEDGRNGNLDCYLSWSVNGPAGLLNGAENAVSAQSSAQQNPDIAFSNGVFHIVYHDWSNSSVVYRTATIEAATGLHQHHIESKISVFPNPARDNLLIDFPDEFKGKSEFILRDQLGRSLFSWTVSSLENKVDLSGIPNGIYSGTLETEKTTFYAKVIVHR